MICFIKHARMACIQTALHELGVQGSKREDILRWNTHHLLICIIFLKACDNVIRVTTSSQIRNEIYLRNICMLSSTNKKQSSWFLHISAKIKAPSTFRNVSIVILLLFCKIKLKDNNNDINNYPTTAINTFIITFTNSVQIGICNIF